MENVLNSLPLPYKSPEFEWQNISASQLESFLNENQFSYMFFNTYIYKPYLKKLDRFGLKCKESECDNLYGAAMIEKIPLPNGRTDRNVLHVAFLATVRGKVARAMAAEWLSAHLSYYKILEGHVPKKWPQSLRFAQWLNFKPIAETANHIIMELKES